MLLQLLGCSSGRFYTAVTGAGAAGDTAQTPVTAMFRGLTGFCLWRDAENSQRSLMTGSVQQHISHKVHPPGPDDTLWKKGFLWGCSTCAARLSEFNEEICTKATVIVILFSLTPPVLLMLFFMKRSQQVYI